MVLVAAREYLPGEEITIMYGDLSNPVLFRQYGFTLPPDEEPGYTCAWSISELCEACDGALRANTGDSSVGAPENAHGSSQDVRGCLAAALTERLPGGLDLDTRKSSESLLIMLKTCVAEGFDPAAFFRKLCNEKTGAYERNSAVLPALSALRRVRAVDPSSVAWWDDDAAHVADQARDEFIRVKMSEYLCVVAHAEALDHAGGDLPHDMCAACAAPLRESMLLALQSVCYELAFQRIRSNLQATFNSKRV